MLFLESDDFLQGPFTGKCNGQKDEIGLDSSQNLSKFSISSLKMALNCLPLSTQNLLFLESDDFLQSPFSQNYLMHFIYTDVQLFIVKCPLVIGGTAASTIFLPNTTMVY